MTSEEPTPSVAAAIRELGEAFPDSKVSCRTDSQGGAYVTMEDVPLNSDIFVQAATWVGFRIGFQYPAAEVYPHHIRSDLARKDGRTAERSQVRDSTPTSASKATRP